MNTQQARAAHTLFYSRVKSWLELHSYTIGEAAKRGNFYDASAFGRACRGYRNANTTTQDKICAAVGVDYLTLCQWWAESVAQAMGVAV